MATVPTNSGSCDEAVPAPGPWSTTVAKATLGARFSSLTNRSGADDTTFPARGLPDDAAMFAANRRHENRHVSDSRDTFNSTIGAWDTKLAAALVAGTPFTGPTEAAATSTLHAAMGGAPGDVAASWVTAAAAGSRSAVDATNPS